MKTTIQVGLILFFFCACGNAPEKEKVQESQTEITEEVEIDSAEVFIMDEGIYAFMDDLFKELQGGSDSNIIIQRVPIPNFDEIGYIFEEESDDHSIFPGGEEGTTHFYATKEDSLFIKQQLESRQNKRWLAEKFRGIPHDSTMLSIYKSKNGFDWDKFKNDGYGCFTSYGLPVFNVDSTRCIIRVNSACHAIAGSGSSIFLEKKNNKWKIVGRKQNWMG